MQFKFIGLYTGGRTSINANGVTFEGDEPSDVTDKEAIRRLKNNVEFEVVGEEEGDGGHERFLQLGIGDDTELGRLRSDYVRVVGRKPYHGWDADTLRAKIAEVG